MTQDMNIYTNGKTNFDLGRFRRAVEDAQNRAKEFHELSPEGDRAEINMTRLYSYTWVLDILRECTSMDREQYQWMYKGEAVCSASEGAEAVAEAMDRQGIPWRCLVIDWMQADDDRSDGDLLDKVFDTMLDNPSDPWTPLLSEMLDDILQLRHDGLDAKDRYGDDLDLQAVRVGEVRE